MLTELRVHNLALIAKAELELGPGLTVLSGETGAGKTALLSSLKLLVGERGDSGMVGTEGNEARVEALFTDIETQQASTLDTLPLDDERKAPDAPLDHAALGEHLVVRRITTEGRSRCYLDDSLVTVGKLSEVLGSCVDLYGQHEHQSLLKTAEQLRILDAYAGEQVTSLLNHYQSQRRAYQDALSRVHELLEMSNSSNVEREQAAFMLREIEKIAPVPGEYALLEQELPRLRHGEQLSEAAHGALELLRGESGALEHLSTAARKLEALRSIDGALDELLEQLEGHAIGLEELVSDLSRYATGIQHDPEALQNVLDRLGELDGLSRRFGPGIDQVFVRLEHAEQLLAGSEDTADRIKEAEERVRIAEEDLRKAAAELSRARKKAQERFVAELNESIVELALTGAQVEFSVQALPFERWESAGSESFELLYRPAPDSTARPLAKIASGGELSRVMLAIKSLLQTGQQSMTLVFDEIDAGVGGKTAVAVAERLALLAESHQVIVITHLAQIAVYANRHFLVDKGTEEGVTRTTITLLDETERVKEIARMLSGTSDAEALQHAQKMLGEAQR